MPFCVKGRCWLYQTCNEFGWYTTTTSVWPAKAQTSATSLKTKPSTMANGIYGGQVPLEYFQQLCHDVFINDVNAGQTTAAVTDSNSTATPAVADNNAATFTMQQMQMNVESTNKVFGGLQQQPYQHVIYTHGLLDPWRAVGLQEGKNVLLLTGKHHKICFFFYIVF